MLKFERECTDYESALFIRVEYEVARSVQMMEQYDTD